METTQQMLSGIEELANQLSEIKKIISKEETRQELDLTPFYKQLDKIEQNLSKMKESNYSSSSEISKLNSSINDIRIDLRTKLPKEDIRYIEIEKPHYWIIGVLVYFIVSLLVMYLLYNSRSNYAVELESAKANDLKYRYLRVKNESLSKYNIANLSTNDVTTIIDSYYKKNPEELERFVIQQEEAIYRALEAQELARQKEIDAKRAQNEAERLKQKIESEGN